MELPANARQLERASSLLVKWVLIEGWTLTTAA